MVICLAENANCCAADFKCPTARHIFIACQQSPTIPTTFGNYFRVFYILPFRKMIVVHHDAEACLTQLARQIFGPQIPVSEEYRIRRQST